MVSAVEALERLREGNRRFASNIDRGGDRIDAAEGRQPDAHDSGAWTWTKKGKDGQGSQACRKPIGTCRKPIGRCRKPIGRCAIGVSRNDYAEVEDSPGRRKALQENCHW